jgi:cytochrome c oxidase subunit 4
MEHASDLLHEDDHKDGHGHPSVLFYNFIAISLFLITGLEVLVLYPPLMHFGDYFKIILLVVLSVGKFAVVVAFFMHLYFDAPILTFLFAIGMVIGTGTVVALIHVMPPAEHPLQPKGKETKIEAKADHAFLERMERWHQLSA